MVEIETERLRLRGWQVGDLEEFAAISADPQVMRYYPKIMNRSECEAGIRRYQAHFEQWGYGLWAAELKDGDGFVGYVGLMRPRFEASFTPCVEVGWRMARRVWNRGLATEAAHKVLDWGFRQADLAEIVSFTVPENRASRRVMEKIGMVHNPADDFDHPLLPAGHPLQRHVLYRKQRELC